MRSVQVPAPRETEGSLPFRRQISRLFEDFFGAPLTLGENGGEWGPAVDLLETADTFVLKAEVPGIQPKEVEVTVNENLVTLRGERKEEKEEKGKSWHRIESRHGSFSRTIHLPLPVDGARAEAEAKDGILTITVPKQKTAVAKKLEVKAK
jgi:HSP20 family protein